MLRGLYGRSGGLNRPLDLVALDLLIVLAAIIDVADGFGGRLCLRLSPDVVCERNVSTAPATPPAASLAF
jgi:hypothetical protein